MSEHTDNRELEDEAMTRVIETDVDDEQDDWIDSESGGWGDGEESEELVPRPRGRLLRPLPLALIAVSIAAAGFLGGVVAQKGSEGGSAAGGLGGGGMPSLAAAQGGGTESGSSEGSSSEAAGSSEGAAGVPASAGSTAAASGTVKSVEGHTIYVKETDGTVVAVKAADGATVTRDSEVAAKKIHPGDTVVVEGSKSGSTVRASSISATESGVETTTGGLGMPGGSESEASVESLFEE